MSWLNKLCVAAIIITSNAGWAGPEGEDFPFRCTSDTKAIELYIAPTILGHTLTIKKDWFDIKKIPLKISASYFEPKLNIESEIDEPFLYLRVQGTISEKNENEIARINIKEGFNKQGAIETKYNCTNQK